MQPRVSNAFRLLGSGELDYIVRKAKKEGMGLKCLSAFGFWGTRKINYYPSWGFSPSQMPFGFWVLGNENNLIYVAVTRAVSNAFRLLGSGEQRQLFRVAAGASGCLKCLSAFGFWGTMKKIKNLTPHPLSLKCLSAFGFWGTMEGIAKAKTEGEMSQMPFGFWVLGNCTAKRSPFSKLPGLKCLSAFGFWGT